MLFAVLTACGSGAIHVKADGWVCSLGGYPLLEAQIRINLHVKGI